MIHIKPCLIAPLALDRKATSPKSRWIRARKVESWYSARLRRIAHYIETFLRQYDAEHPERNGWIVDALNRYAETLDPWARSVGEAMISEVAARDRKAWREVSAEMGSILHREMDTAPLGAIVRQRLDDQVALIKSIPREAAERVHKLTIENAYTGERFTEIAKRIMEGGQVSRSRATMIARTEVGRTLTEITKARSESIGSTHFVWRTVRDVDVRPTHKALEGKTFAWADPPECDPGHHALPGSIWNCFPGDMVVGLGNGVKRIFRSHYAGEIVDIGGIQPVSATANHPILTGRGWVPAREISEGDYLVYPIDDAKFVVDANVDQPKPTFAQLFSAFESAKVETPEGVEFDFYGDRPNGKVDLIAFDDPLSDDVMADVAEGGSNLVFARTNSGVVVSVVGRGSKVSHPCHSSGCDEIETVAIGHSAHANDVGFRSATGCDPVPLENLPDHGACDAVVDRESELALSGLVGCDNFALGQGLSVRGRTPASNDLHAEIAQFDAENVRVYADGRGGIFQSGACLYKFHRVSNVHFRYFSGHVYTIETIIGWYGVTHASAIVKNCRCFAEPVLVDV